MKTSIETHTWNRERFAELTRAELNAMPGCEVFWRYTGEYFAGYMREKTCNFVSERSGRRIYVTDDLRLTPTEIWIRDEAFDEDGARVFGHPERIHHKNRKVRYFSGWGIVRPGGPGADAEGDDWFAIRDVVMHNEGQIVRIPDETGAPSGYSFQLERLTYQATRIAVLKLGLIEDATGHTFAYTWANPDAERIGINLRWIQVGLTLRESDTAFGFDVP